MVRDFRHACRKELDLLDTTFVWDVDTRIFRAIVLECVRRIEGVEAVCEAGFFAFGKNKQEYALRGIQVEQDQKHQALNITVEVNLRYGFKIPEKAREIQERVVTEITELTGIRVSSVHVFFKNLLIDMVENSSPSFEANDLGGDLSPDQDSEEASTLKRS